MSSSALPNSPKRLYSRAAAADGKAIYLKPLDKKQKKEARINTVFNGEYIPKEVYLKRPLSAAGLMKIRQNFSNNQTEAMLTPDWNFLNGVNDPKFYMEFDGPRNTTISFPHLVYLNPLQTNKWWNRFLKIQKVALQPGFKTDLLNLEIDVELYLEERGWAFDLATSTEPAHQPGGVHFAKSIKSGNETYREIRDEVIRISCEMIRESFPELASAEQEKRWAVEAPMTVGGKENLWFTTIQINITELDKDLRVQIKSKGGLNFDINDDSITLSVLLMLSHFEKGTFPGYLNIYSTRISVPCHTYGAVIFTGRHPHGSSGLGPLPNDYDPEIHVDSFSKVDYPAEMNTLSFGRLHFVSYPRMDLTNPRKKELSSKWFSEDHRDLQVSHFWSLKGYFEWRACFHVKTNWAELKDAKDISAIQKMFEWKDEDGTKQVVNATLIQKAFDFGGRKLASIEKLRKAAIATNCGNCVPNASKPKKPRTKLNPNLTAEERDLARKERMTKVTCTAQLASGADCKRKFRKGRHSWGNVCKSCWKRAERIEKGPEAIGKVPCAGKTKGSKNKEAAECQGLIPKKKSEEGVLYCTRCTKKLMSRLLQLLRGIPDEDESPCRAAI